MSSRLLTDDLWNEIAHGFPVQPRSPLGGRLRANNRVVLTAILFVLKTGIAWADVLIDTGLVKAPLGEQKPARTPRIAAAAVASPL